MSRTSTPILKDDASVIVIPYAHNFDLMLKALNLPPTLYRHKICPGGKFHVTVTFSSSLELLDGLLAPNSISGMLSTDYEEAEDSAAIEAIRYMENACNREIRDYHYTHVKKLENQIRCMVWWLFATNETIKKLRKGWYYAVRYMSSYSDQIQNTTSARHLRGQDGTKGVMKAALASIEELTERLRYIGMKSEQHLETIKDSF